MTRRIVIAVLLLLLAAGLWFAYGPRRTPVGQASLAELRDIDAFERWFNDSVSSTRVIVLLSPT